MKFNNSLFSWICLTGIIILLLLAAFGCSTEKHIVRTTETVDSTAIHEKDSIIQVHIQEIERLASEVYGLQYAGVTFRVDTVLVNSRTDTVVNTVTITKEGDIKASGAITGAYVSKNYFSKIINEWKYRYDSLSQVKQKESIRYITNTVTVDKKVKRSFMNFWWLLLVGIAGGYVLRSKGKLFGII